MPTWCPSTARRRREGGAAYGSGDGKEVGDRAMAGRWRSRGELREPAGRRPGVAGSGERCRCGGRWTGGRGEARDEVSSTSTWANTTACACTWTPVRCQDCMPRQARVIPQVASGGAELGENAVKIHPAAVQPHTVHYNRLCRSNGRALRPRSLHVTLKTSASPSCLLRYVRSLSSRSP